MDDSLGELEDALRIRAFLSLEGSRTAAEGLLLPHFFAGFSML